MAKCRSRTVEVTSAMIESKMNGMLRSVIARMETGSPSTSMPARARTVMRADVAIPAVQFLLGMDGRQGQHLGRVAGKVVVAGPVEEGVRIEECLARFPCDVLGLVRSSCCVSSRSLPAMIVSLPPCIWANAIRRIALMRHF